MADFESNGMATLGQGVYTQTSDAAARFVSEGDQLTDYGANESNAVAPDFVDLLHTPTPVGDNSGQVLGDLSLGVQNDYPMPGDPTVDRMALSFNVRALKDGVDLGPLTGIYDGLLDNPYAAFGVAPPPTFYKMRVWNTVQLAFEYWVSEGSPSSANPSGQATLAGSLTVIAVKRPKDLVGQGPS